MRRERKGERPSAAECWRVAWLDRTSGQRGAAARPRQAWAGGKVARRIAIVYRAVCRAAAPEEGVPRAARAAPGGIAVRGVELGGAAPLPPQLTVAARPSRT